MPSDPCTGAQGANSPPGVHHGQGPRHWSPPGALGAGGARLLPVPRPVPSAMDGTRMMAGSPHTLHPPIGLPSALRAPEKPMGEHQCCYLSPATDRQSQPKPTAEKRRERYRGAEARGGMPDVRACRRAHRSVARLRGLAYARLGLATGQPPTITKGGGHKHIRERQSDGARPRRGQVLSESRSSKIGNGGQVRRIPHTRENRKISAGPERGRSVHLLIDE